VYAERTRVQDDLIKTIRCGPCGAEQIGFTPGGEKESSIESLQADDQVEAFDLNDQSLRSDISQSPPIQRLWTTPEMQHGMDHDGISRGLEVHRVRERVHQRTSDVA